MQGVRQAKCSAALCMHPNSLTHPLSTAAELYSTMIMTELDAAEEDKGAGEP